MDNEAPVLVSEAARLARISEDSIRKAFDDGKLAGRRTSSGLRLIDRRSLEAFVLRRVSEKSLPR